MFPDLITPFVAPGSSVEARGDINATWPVGSPTLAAYVERQTDRAKRDDQEHHVPEGTTPIKVFTAVDPGAATDWGAVWTQGGRTYNLRALAPSVPQGNGVLWVTDCIDVT